MAHSGNARSQRLTRLMKQKHRTRHEGVEPAGQAGEDSAGSLISGMKKAHVMDHSKRHGSSEEVLHKDWLEKRDDSAVPPGSQTAQTAAPATVATVVDAPPDTATALPTSVSDASNEPSTTVSVPVETPPVAVPSASPLTEIPTPSPVPTTFTADTSVTTSANDTTITPTASVPLSLDISVSISVSVPTSIALINSSNTQSSALIPSARSSSVVPSSTPIASPKPTSTTGKISSSTSANGTSSYGSYSSTTTYSGDYSTNSVSATTTADLYGTGVYVGGGDSGATATGQVPSATTSSSSGGGLDPVTTRRIVGGVVGGLAGAFFLLALLLFLLRRRKTALFGPNRGLPASDGTGGTAGGGSDSRAEMASRRSSRDPLFTASYFAPAFAKRWRQSNQTLRSDDSTFTSTTTSERGFQKISGRKIPSVLQSGGDGYGGGFDQGSPTASEPSMSLPPGSPVQPRSVISQPPPSMPYGMPLDVSYTREADEPESVVVFRPSPARTPVASSTNVSVVNVPAASRAIPQPGGTLSPTRPPRPDGLGRSHPSFDGSRGSRFTESLDGL